MSLEISWDALTTGPSGVQLAESIRDFIHEKFQQVELPRFIRSVHVHSFDFGKESPTVDLKDICDPLPEFYEDDESDDEEVDGLREEVTDDHELHSLSGASHQTGFSAHPSIQKTATTPSFREIGVSNSRTGAIFRDQVATPFLSRSNTPGIPGGTSNLSYFHLPLSAGLSGTQTPLAAVTPFTPPWTDYHHQNRHPSTSAHSLHSEQLYADPSSRPSTAHSAAHNAPGISPPPVEDDSSNRTTKDSPHPLDLQTTLHISYSGSLSLALTAEVLLDYPMPSFVGIPLKLQITGLSFDGVGLIAYLNPREKGSTSKSEGADAEPEKEQQSRGKVKFCFVGTEDARVMLGSNVNSTDSTPNLPDVAGSGGTASHDRKDLPLGSLLRSIRVDTEIGRQGEGKPVLKNVGKVEKFVLEQVRRIFEEEFVWPSFWTFLV